MVFSNLYDINVVELCMYFKYNRGLSDHAVCLFLFSIFWLLVDFIFFFLSKQMMVEGA